jgi:hypothetical protein
MVEYLAAQNIVQKVLCKLAMLINTAGHEQNIELKFGDNVIPLASDVKDLGVLIDSKLSFTVHINHIVAKAFTRTNLFLTREL